MTNRIGTKIALLSLILAPVFANATAAVTCTAKIPFKGEVLNVSVERGVKNVSAAFELGYLGNIKSQEYTVNKTLSADLRDALYKGKGFTLSVDTAAKTATLKAKLDNKWVHLPNLICEFNEFDPKPGVTISN